MVHVDLILLNARTLFIQSMILNLQYVVQMVRK